MLQTIGWPAHMETVPGLPDVLIDYSAISADEFSRVARFADVIMAINCGSSSSGSAVVVYGRDTLVRLAADLEPARPMVVMPFAVDFDTDQVERLCAAVKRTKGAYEWDIAVN